MKEKVFFTFHDELLYDLIIPKNVNKKNKAVARFDDEKDFLSVHELFLLLILLDRMKKSDSTQCSLSIKDIHHGYRNKRVGRAHLISKSELEKYKNSVNSLQNRHVLIDIKNARKRFGIKNTKNINTKIFGIKKSTSFENGNIVFNYKFGKYGDILLKSKRFSDILPIEFIHVSYQQVMILYIALYLGRFIFINQRKHRNSYTVNITSIMNGIMIHDKLGNNTGKTLFDVLQTKIPNKYTYIETFKNDLLYVLDILKTYKKIVDYRIIPLELSDMSIKNYMLCKLQVDLKK